MTFGEYIRAKYGPDMKALTRAERMAARFKQGETLAQIGESYGLSHERVRQILRASFGIARQDGGQAVAKVIAREQRAAAKNEARDQVWLATVRCTRGEYRRLTGQQFCTRSGPAHRYRSHKASAGQRGISFELTFPEWWAIWQESGHYAERRAGGYVMARNGDAGPYAVGNVR